MATPKSSFLEKVLGRLGRLDAEGLQSVVQRLARERTFLETLFNSIEDGVLVVGADGKILYFNHAATKLLGLAPETAEGESIERYLPDLEWTKLIHMDREGGRHSVRHEFEIAYPRPRFIRLYASPLDGDQKGSAGLALILHDATEARQRAFEAIESERVQALTLLAASVAHEIGNPINALHIHLQLMEREMRKLRPSLRALAAGKSAGRRGKAPPERTEAEADAEEALGKLDQYLGVAKGEIVRLDYIITQFLQALRPTPPQLKQGSLNDVVAETLALLSPELENRGLLVKQRLAKALPHSMFDAGQIKQVLVNLVKNSMQAMTKGGAITLQTGADSDGVWVRVDDTGGGIPPDHLNRIFEPFFTTKKKGSGLGLMIVQRIVRDHGGRIGVESHVGRGTSFRIWLPFAERPTRLLEERLHD